MRRTSIPSPSIKLEDYTHRGRINSREKKIQMKCQFIFSCDGTIKTIEKPLESDDAVVLLQHENEMEAVVTDENNTFYCGMCHSQRERRKSLAA